MMTPETRLQFAAIDMAAAAETTDPVKAEELYVRAQLWIQSADKRSTVLERAIATAELRRLARLEKPFCQR